MQEMYIAGYSHQRAPERPASVTIGPYRLNRLPRIPGLEDKLPELFELADAHGNVYAVDADKDLLVTFIHCAHPRMIGPPLRAVIRSPAEHHVLMHVRIQDLERRALFEYYEVWCRDELWGRFPTEAMAQIALSSLKTRAA